MFESRDEGSHVSLENLIGIFKSFQSMNSSLTILTIFLIAVVVFLLV